MTARTLTVANQKGGVGKTTTTFHLARAAVVADQRVLVVDADPQGNFTSVGAREPLEDDEVGLADALSGRSAMTMRDVIVPGIWPGLDVVPTTGDQLSDVRDELVIAKTGRESRLRNALSEVRDDYDLILVDALPGIDQLLVNALTAADGVLIVTHTKLFSSNGLAALLRTISDVQTYYNPSLRVAGILANEHQASTRAAAAWSAEIDKAAQGLDLHLLRPFVPKSQIISDAVEAARGLDEWPERASDARALAAIYAAHLKTLEGSLR
ncbi:ParA family protein [Arsenicicoccus bolidensis]|uniref:ParA family protein n=1 Tax=Arsenicicoccus bolidensis TaxID=229480 RepID=UPI0028AC351A|nr:AAA family ATPase [Arsenicicoccus bolidensis]